MLRLYMFVDKKDNPELELTSTFFSLYYFVFQYIKERCLSIFDFLFLTTLFL